MLKADNIVSTRQYLLAMAITILLILILLIRFFQLQILDYDRYSQKANSNRIRKVTTSAPRGMILDRNGKILVDNLPTYILNAIPGELSNKGKTFHFISNILNIDSNNLATSFKKYYRGKFIPTRLAKDLSFSQISRLEENRLDLEGVYFQQFPERYFPSNVRASHILGYVKEVDRVIRNSLENPSNYEFGDIIGWSGLEKSYEKYLKGSHGVQFYQVDAFGREAGFVEDFNPISPEPGNNIKTTIDINIQSSLEQLMEGKRGVVLVSIPSTGEILGAVSKPDFRPNLFTGRILENDWNTIINNPEKPLVNRFNQGLYPPGSIVKMITQAIMLENPEFHYDIHQKCDGFYQFGDRLFGCWYELGHGSINLTSAIAQSCDIYFYKTIDYYNLDQLAKYFYDFGFGAPTGVDIENEYQGTIPDTEYMNDRYGRSGWSRGSLLNFCIGQGELLVTPMQVLQYLNLLAMKGETYQPHFVITENVHMVKKPNIKNKTWDKIRSDMYQVIYNEKGTGKKANIENLDVEIFGKTGTAENPHGEDHAWFIGWVEYLDNKISVVILLENAGSGGAVAAPIAKLVFSEVIQNNKRIALNK
mgnify:CR=1 FL=1